MSSANLLFVLVGAVALLSGIVMIVKAIQSGGDERPRNSALLIGGMMAAAFGLVLGGFVIVYSTTAPLEYSNAEAAQ